MLSNPSLIFSYSYAVDGHAENQTRSTPLNLSHLFPPLSLAAPHRCFCWLSPVSATCALHQDPGSKCGSLLELPPLVPEIAARVVKASPRSPKGNRGTDDGKWDVLGLN